MDVNGRPDELRDYLERWGMLFELLGATRMMGKVLGWLLISDPPEQTAADIAAAISASAGSVSATTRALVQATMIERIGVPGERSAYFRVRAGMWGHLLRRRMSYVSSMTELADEGITFADAGDKGSTLRLREIGSYCRFVERELPEFISRWEKEWAEEQRS